MRKKGKVHISGVCGVAMGGVAVLLKEYGFEVTGSDSLFFPPMSEQLRRYGIPTFQFSKENIKDADFVVVGNSVSKDNEEVQESIALGKKMYSYPEIINELFGDKRFFVIAGTHGKTTTTSCVSFLLWMGGYSPSFLVGGVPINFGVSAKLGQGDIFVIEGDEYDTAFFDKTPKFWHFNPERAVVGPIEYDHADMYKTFDDYKRSFVEFSRRVKNKIAFFSSDVTKEVVSESKATDKVSFGWGEESDLFPSGVKKVEFGYSFKIRDLPYEFRLNLFGRHNIINSIASISLLSDILKFDRICDYIPHFKGVRRRLEVIFSSQDFVVIDDFAHHPTEIASGIASIREFFDVVYVAFEPRSYTSRTQAHLEGFKKAFELADAIFIGKIFKEDKIPEKIRLNTAELVSYLRSKGKYAVYDQNVAERFIEFLSSVDLRKKTAVIFMTSGDFYGERDKFILGIRRFMTTHSIGQAPLQNSES